MRLTPIHQIPNIVWLFSVSNMDKGEGLHPDAPPLSYGPGARVEGFKEKRRVEEVEEKVAGVAGGRRGGRVV